MIDHEQASGLGWVGFAHLERTLDQVKVPEKQHSDLAIPVE